MTSSVIDILISCGILSLSLLGIFIQSKGGQGSLYDKRFRWSNPKRITTRGWITILIALFIAGLTGWQIKRTNDEKTDSVKRQRISDSTQTAEINKGIAKNRKELFDDVSKAFARQGLQLDTVTNQLLKLRDSVKTITVNNIQELERPILLVQDRGITHEINGDTIILRIQLVSKQAACAITSINFFAEFNSQGKEKRLSTNSLKLGRLLLAKEQAYQVRTEYSPMTDFEYVNVALWGDYTSDNGKHKYKFSEVYQYNKSTNRTSFLMPDARDRFFKNYQLYKLSN
jgi:hypothetical protein